METNGFLRTVAQFGVCRSFFVIAFLGIHSPLVEARQDFYSGSHYTSSRGIAMGDAFSPLADDVASALFYNPASVARIKGFETEPLNLSGNINSGVVGGIGTDTVKLTDFADYAPVIAADTEVAHGGSFAVLPSLGFRGLALGVLYQKSFRAISTDGATVEYQTQNDFIPSIGMGFRLASGVVKVGYVAQWINRASGTVSVDSAAASSYSDGLATGSGIAHNLGVTVTLPSNYTPTVSIVSRNFLGTTLSDAIGVDFLASNPSGTLESLPMTYDLAVGFEPKLGGAQTMKYVFEYRDLLGESGEPLLGRLRTGLEIGLGGVLFIRGGFGGGYPSAGLGLRTPRSEFSFAWFSNEMGTGFRSSRDVQYMAQLRLRFSGY